VSARGLVAGLALAGVIACGAAHKEAAMPRNPPEVDGPGSAGPEQARIQKLFDEIAAQQQRAHVDVAAPMTTGPATPLDPAPHHDDASCHPGPSDACGESCRLADSICDNAKKICDIATTKLANDAWAAEKCNSAKDSCTASHERCCGCQ